MIRTFILALCFILAILLMLYAAVALVQEQRVVKGWFPENPKRHDYYEALRLKRPR